MNTVCLCGSTRFLDDFNYANIELSKRGLSVLTISMCLPKNEQASPEDEAFKELLDLVHLNKILRADAVFVVGDGYIGRSTAREILWAHMHAKPIIMQSSARSWDEYVLMLTRRSIIQDDAVTIANRVLGLPTTLAWPDFR